MKYLMVYTGMFMLCFNFSFAQNSILAGKIVDENNQPVHGAVITVTNRAAITKTVSDADGLYYTKPIPEGRYKVTVKINDKNLKVGELTATENNRSQVYYMLTFSGTKVTAKTETKDPFAEAKMSKIQASNEYFDDPIQRPVNKGQHPPMYTHFIMTDTSSSPNENEYRNQMLLPDKSGLIRIDLKGRIQEIQAAPSPPPRVK